MSASAEFKEKMHQRVRNAMLLEKTLEHVDLAGLVDRLMLNNAEGVFARLALQKWFAAPPDEDNTNIAVAELGRSMQLLDQAYTGNDDLIRGPRESAAAELILGHIRQLASGSVLDRFYVQQSLFSLLRMLDIQHIAELCDVTRSPIAIETTESQVERLNKYVRQIVKQYESDQLEYDKLEMKEGGTGITKYGVPLGEVQDVSGVQFSESSKPKKRTKAQIVNDEWDHAIGIRR